MDGESVERLELRHGEKVTAAHVNTLDANVRRNTRLAGLHVRRHSWPWGTSHSFHGLSGSGSAPVFQPAVSILDPDTAEVRWSGPRSTIGGIAPTIDDEEIFTTNETTGLRPALTVTRGDFGPQGECGIYFRLTVTPIGFEPEKVVPIALGQLADRKAYQADTLALFLRLRGGSISYDEEDDRALFFNQGFMAVKRRPSGIFEAVFYIK